jgi:hypothetical protein
VKNEQLKNQAFPDRSDTSLPIFTWRKTALIGDEFYIWWLYYGYADRKNTLCHRVFRHKSKPLDRKARISLAWSLRIEKAKLKRAWRKHYQCKEA